jgi:hypothetical protein
MSATALASPPEYKPIIEHIATRPKNDHRESIDEILLFAIRRKPIGGRDSI